MNRDREIEREFSNGLDRILAGEEVHVAQPQEGDLLSALDFALKMVQLRPSPSADFESNLKARLLQELAEQESCKEDKRSWLGRLISEPAWVGAAVAFFLIIAGGLIWQSGLFRTSQQPLVNAPVPAPAMTSAAGSAAKQEIVPTASPAPPSAASGPAASPSPAPRTLVSVDAVTNKATYSSGESINVEVSMRNSGTEPLKIDKFPPVVSLMKADTQQPVYTFSAGKDVVTIAPGGTANFTLSWNQTDSGGNRVPGGSYYVELENLDLQGRSMQLNLSRPARFEILPPTSGSPASRTLISNQSQTSTGITITLRRIVFSDSGFAVHALISPPPDYGFLPLGGPNSSSKSFGASAAYSVDGGWVKDAGPSSVEYQASSMNHVWAVAEPIPSGSGQLVFIVNSVGSWRGNWQFYVSLK
jgi:hypothetical protein